MPISITDFDYLRFLVREKSGIALEPDKRYLTETRLRPLVRQEGLHSVDQLLTRLRRGPFGRLHRQVIEAFATKETHFFRDTYVFEVLEAFVFPDLIKSCKQRKELNIWSAACSSGQEPYSVAMLLAENFPFLDRWAVRILASDFSEEILTRARQGMYGRVDISRGLPPALLHKYFQKQGPLWQIQEQIRRKIEFRNINLIETFPALPRMDIVFLRNVLIYFDIKVRQQILRKIQRAIRPGGYLLAGTAETPDKLNNAFEQIQFDNAMVYRLRN